jgi:hypothetical protein
MTTPTSTAVSRARPIAIGVAWLGAALALLVACSAASSPPEPLAREDVYRFDSLLGVMSAGLRALLIPTLPPGLLRRPLALGHLHRRSGVRRS